MKCPNCNREIFIAKNSLVNCRCGAKLLLAVVNGKSEIHDLTPDKEDEKVE